MELSELSIGQSVTIKDDDIIKISITRITEGEAITEYFAPEDGKRVLKLIVTIPNGRTSANDIDYSFWTVSLDGNPLSPGTPAKGNIIVDPKKRTIKVTSS